MTRYGETPIFVIHIPFKESDLHRFLFLISLNFMALKKSRYSGRADLSFAIKGGFKKKNGNVISATFFFVAEGKYWQISAETGSGKRKQKKAP
ncbi:hypothetical protein LNP74_13210 [Klebsiella pneumoniae subsp. pneumoniae]|nr:hypothetical protein [Klebsiella pneumoniae subsp. pneumoniae]